MNSQTSVPFISIISPMYNESKVIDLFLKELSQVLDEIELDYEILCVNDGSRDDSLEKLQLAQKKYPQLRIINLSRNFGKEAALTAGLDMSRGDLIIPMDADLQHPPEVIKQFIEKWREGYDVVVAKRTSRDTDGLRRRSSSRLFYKLINKMSSYPIPEDVGDFRLMTRKVVQAIQSLPENQRFMKGLFSWVGFKTAIVEFSPAERAAGKSSFNLWGLWNFALDGITSFSSFPVRVWLYIGLVISSLAFLYGTITIIQTLVYGIDAPGYASLLTAILFLGGIQLVGLGVLGEYIGRMYMETKRRPIYIVKEEL